MIKLLATKFSIPRVRSSLVARPRLLERIDLGLQGKLTLISALAGAGKTTLLAEWQVTHNERHMPLVWVSLDESDNDSTRFWSYIAKAVEMLAPGIGEDTLTLLHSFPAPPIEAVLIPLLNAISSNIQQDFALVLDDYHCIVTQSIHTSLTYMLDHLPSTMHIVLITRTDPPLSLARLRVRGQLTEIRTADLRFTPAETALYLNQFLKLQVSLEDAARLTERTEGWIAGLQLAALSLQRQENSAEFLRTFNGNHRYVLEYLTQEVFEQQPASIQRFLQDTAILSRLSADICNEVMHTTDSQTVLNWLDKANLFVVSLDEEQRWYRYHTLFRDFLLQLLHKAQSKEYICNLHIRAAMWYEQQQLMHDAVEHMLASNDFEQAAQLIERIARSVWMRGEAITLACWLQMLPQPIRSSHPQLGLFSAWSFIAKGQLDKAQHYLKETIEGLSLNTLTENSEQTSMQAEIIILQATIARFLNDVPRTLELSQRAAQYLSQDDDVLNSINTLNLGHAYHFQGDIEAASAAFKQSVMFGRAVGNIYTVLLALNNLVQLQVEHGTLTAATNYCEESLHFAARHSCEQLPIMGDTYIKEGKLLYERNMLQKAVPKMEHGIKLARKGSVRFLLQGYMAQARLLHARGEGARALELLQRASDLARKRSSSLLILQIAALQARLWLAQGQYALAFSWLKHSNLNVADAPEYAHEFEYLTLVRLLIAQGKTNEVLAPLERLRQVALAGGRNGIVIEVFLLQALANYAQKQATEAFIALEQALSLAEPEGYVRLFLDEGPIVAQLLTGFVVWQESKSTRTATMTHSYVNVLLANFTSAGSTVVGTSLQKERDSTRQLEYTSLIERLGEREMQVLRYLAAGLSNQAIAEEMVVALSTIKSHLKSIYRKLNVDSRTQAVAKAREFHLL